MKAEYWVFHLNILVIIDFFFNKHSNNSESIILSAI